MMISLTTNIKTTLLTTVLMTLFMMAGSVAAATPGTMNLQGLLVDNVGAPVSDGVYSVTFNIWDADAAGNSLWNEVQNVTTVDGLFSVTLGTFSPISDTAFDAPNRWIGIQVEADPEMTPRTEITSAPFAFRTSTIDGATGGSISGTISFSGNSTPMMEIYPSGTQNPERGIAVHSPNWQQYGLFYVDTVDHIDFTGGSGVSDPAVTVALDGWPGGGYLGVKNNNPEYTLDVTGTSRSTNLMVDGSAGDATVMLPESSVNSDELLNEPGFAFSTSTPVTSIDTSNFSTNVQEFISVTLTAPAAGYVVVETECTFLLTSTVDDNFVWLFIDTAAGTTWDVSSTYLWAGGGAFANSYNHYSTVSLKRVFPVSAGTDTYRAKGGAWTANAPGAGTYLFTAQIQATYYPTSYGPVVEGVADPGGADVIDFSSSIDPMTGQSVDQYTVDLRYYENRAKEARIKALEAELELRKAEQLAKAQEAQNESQRR